MSIAFRRRRRTQSLIPNYVVLILLACFTLGPLLVLVFNSFKTSEEIGANPLGPPIEGFRIANYADAWVQGNYAVTLLNSALVVTGTVAGVCVIAGLAAYALARLDLPGADGFVLYLLIGTSLPFQLFLFPLFFLWQRLGLVNSLFGLMIIYWATSSPFATFLLRSFMISVPVDFEEAARIDGANTVQIIRHVMLPIVWPGFLTVALLAGLGAWNEFLFANTFISDENRKTVVSSYYAFVGRFTTDWGLTSAAAVITIFPVLFFFLMLQRRFIQGLTQGGLKS
jgi:raffinose/stachyose/melibiose transport system permease protein